MELRQLKKIMDSGKSIYDIPFRVVFYARVSTEKDEQLNSLDNQVGYYNDFIRKNKNWSFAGSYIDEGISAKSTKNRNSFLQMIDDAKSCLFDLIITKEISRFSRNTLDSIKYTQELLSYGVGVFFQSDNINTLTPDSELRLTIMASIAQEEVRKLSERCKFGFSRAIEKGVVLGQDNITGYRKKNGRLTICEEEAKIVRKIFDIYTEGKVGVRRIARMLENEGIVDGSGKMYTFATLSNIIQNPKYKGFYCGKKYAALDYRTGKNILLSKDEWITYKDENIPAIVDEETWNKANVILEERGKKARENSAACQNRYPYSGKLFCGEHGTSYHRHVYSGKKGDNEVWNCKMYRLKGKIDGCDSPTIYTRELNEIMLSVYKTLYVKKDEIIGGLVSLYEEASADESVADTRERLRDEINKINVKKEKLLEYNIDGSVTKQEFVARNNNYNEKINSLQSGIDDISQKLLLIDKNKRGVSEIKNLLNREWDERLIYENKFTEIVLDKIIVHKTGDNTHVRLEICLKLGEKFDALLNIKNHCITLYDIPISEATSV